ncbi:MAG: transposase [Bacteroidota bacterium]|jgi:REP element-mobilizing transposase RayT
MSTYSQIYVHAVFGVKGKNSLILPAWEQEFHKYIVETSAMRELKIHAINGMPDHLHVLVGLKPTWCVSDMVREIKRYSNNYVQDRRLTKYDFQWQEGFAAFSCSHSSLAQVVAYIEGQKEHHRHHSFREEYAALLLEHGLDLKNRHVFEWIDEDTGAEPE